MQGHEEYPLTNPWSATRLERVEYATYYILAPRTSGNSQALETRRDMNL